MSITFLHDQVCVDLFVIEPPWDLQPAAVHAGIAPLSVQDGQRHVSVCHPAQQLVPGGLPEEHSPVLRGEDGVGAFGRGHESSSPTEAQDAVSPGVIPAGQSDIAPDEANDFGGAGRHCGGKTLIKLDDTMQIVINKCSAKKCIHTRTPTSPLQMQANKKAQNIDSPWVRTEKYK